MSLKRLAEACIRCRPALLAGAGAVAVLTLGTGCETDSFLDPSRTGYFEFVPTTMPILKRLDVIETAVMDNAIVGPPEPEDLIPSVREYVLGPDDVLQIEIYELVTRNETEQFVRRIDPDGYIRIPVIGSVPAIGLTIDQLVERIKQKLIDQNIIRTNPIVNITPEETRSYQYKVMGSVLRGGLFALNRTDLRLTDALALAQGAFPTTQTIRIVRTVQDLRYTPPDRDAATPTTPAPTPTAPRPAPFPATPQTPPPDIEALIEQLNVKGAPAPSTPPGTPPSAPPAETPPSPPPAPEGAAPGASKPIEPPASPGALRDSRVLVSAVAGQQQGTPIDVDTLEPVRIADMPPVVDNARRQVTTAPPNDGTTFVFDQERQQWVRVPAGSVPPAGTAPHGALTGPAAAGRNPPPPRYSGPPTRVIEIPYLDLINGVPGLDVIIQPGDMINADSGDRGVVYIDGEVTRPGVYQLPEGGRLTVSRLVAAAGGLNQIAIPERCDLIRKVGEDKEATIRISVAAIRNRGEPDIYCKPDDHVIIGTNFWATPLAVFRNGFRVTYGFGFLLDRNFGNDVFGAPPVNVVGE